MPSENGFCNDTCRQRHKDGADPPKHSKCWVLKDTCEGCGLMREAYIGDTGAAASLSFPVHPPSAQVAAVHAPGSAVQERCESCAACKVCEPRARILELPPSRVLELSPSSPEHAHALTPESNARRKNEAEPQTSGTPSGEQGAPANGTAVTATNMKKDEESKNISVCAEHNQKYTMYCVEDKQAVCLTCVEQSHDKPGCSLKSLTGLLDANKPAIDALLAYTQELIPALSTVAHAIDVEATAVNAQRERVQTNIRQWVVEAHAAIDQRSAQLLAEVDAQLPDCAAVYGRAEELQAGMREGARVVEAHTASRSALAALQAQQALEMLVNEASACRDKAAETLARLQLRPHLAAVFGNDFKEYVLGEGAVVDENALQLPATLVWEDAPEFKDGALQVKTGKENKNAAVMAVRNKQGQPLRGLRGLFSASLNVVYAQEVGADNNPAPECAISEREDGMYRLTVKVFRETLHRLVVTFRNEAVGGTPVSVQGVQYFHMWGKLGRGDGEFDHPRGVAICGDGLLLVADGTNHRIQCFRRDGTFVRKIVGTQLPQGNGYFQYPRYVTQGPDKTIYINALDNASKCCVLAFGDNFAFKYTVPVELTGWAGLAVDSSDRLYIAHLSGTDIQVWKEKQLVKTFPCRDRDGSTVMPYAVAVAPDGMVYVTTQTRRILVFRDYNGELVDGICSEGSGDGQRNRPYSLALGPNGTLFVAEYSNHRVMQVSRKDGKFVRVFGTSGKEGSGPGQFHFPWGVIYDDKDGAVYVSEQHNHRIQVFGVC